MNNSKSRAPLTKKGFTLAEILVAIASFSVFSLLMATMLIMGMRSMNKSNAQLQAQNTSRNILESIITEMREGMPNPHAATGYLFLGINAKPTSVLYPNTNTRNTDYVCFTRLNFKATDPMNNGFDKASPNSFKQIRYFVQNNKTLIREVKTISGAALQPPSTAVLAEAPDGKISLAFTYVNDRTYNISVTVTEDAGQDTEVTYTSTSTVFILGD